MQRLTDAPSRSGGEGERFALNMLEFQALNHSCCLPWVRQHFGVVVPLRCQGNVRFNIRKLHRMAFGPSPPAQRINKDSATGHSVRSTRLRRVRRRRPTCRGLIRGPLKRDIGRLAVVPAHHRGPRQPPSPQRSRAESRRPCRGSGAAGRIRSLGAPEPVDHPQMPTEAGPALRARPSVPGPSKLPEGPCATSDPAPLPTLGRRSGSP